MRSCKDDGVTIRKRSGRPTNITKGCDLPRSFGLIASVTRKWKHPFLSAYDQVNALHSRSSLSAKVRMKHTATHKANARWRWEALPGGFSIAEN